MTTDVINNVPRELVLALRKIAERERRWRLEDTECGGPEVEESVSMLNAEIDALLATAQPAADGEPLTLAEDPRSAKELSLAGCNCIRFGEGNPHWPCRIHLAAQPAKADGVAVPDGWSLELMGPDEVVKLKRKDGKWCGVTDLSESPRDALLYGFFRAYLAAAPAPPVTSGAFKLGDPVRKTKGSQWSGRVVGTYATALTPEGYAVESSTEIGSVQIYPASALELVPDDLGLMAKSEGVKKCD